MTGMDEIIRRAVEISGDESLVNALLTIGYASLYLRNIGPINQGTEGYEEILSFYRNLQGRSDRERVIYAVRKFMEAFV